MGAGAFGALADGRQVRSSRCCFGYCCVGCCCVGCCCVGCCCVGCCVAAYWVRDQFRHTSHTSLVYCLVASWMDAVLDVSSGVQWLSLLRLRVGIRGDVLRPDAAVLRDLDPVGSAGGCGDGWLAKDRTRESFPQPRIDVDEGRRYVDASCSRTKRILTSGVPEEHNTNRPLAATRTSGHLDSRPLLDTQYAKTSAVRDRTCTCICRFCTTDELWRTPRPHFGWKLCLAPTMFTASQSWPPFPADHC